jgi:deazaflavin-dependent oxidoreductase (nitroreductase family)
VVVASKGGAPTHPAWFHNLVKHPIVTVEVEGETFKAKANVVEDDEEYERLYAQHAAIMPGFNEYRQKTSRKIPVIVLEPIDEAVA